MAIDHRSETPPLLGQCPLNPFFGKSSLITLTVFVSLSICISYLFLFCILYGSEIYFINLLLRMYSTIHFYFHKRVSIPNVPPGTMSCGAIPNL